MLKNILIAIISLITLSACVTSSNQRLNTTTGKPEVIIEGMSQKDIASAIMNQMLSWDFQLQRQEDSILVFNKKNTSLSGAILFGSRYDSTPEWRFTYNLVEYGDGIRVVANIASVTNPGSAFERITDMSKGSKDAQNVQSFLNNLKTTSEIKSRGKVGVMLDNRNVIVNVMQDSPAEKAGFLKGDVLLKINGEGISEDLATNTMRITGEPGTTVILTILRNGADVLTIPIVRGNP